MLLYTLSKHLAISEENPVEKNVGHNSNDLQTDYIQIQYVNVFHTYRYL